MSRNPILAPDAAGQAHAYLGDMFLALDWPKLTVAVLVLVAVLAAIGRWEERRKRGGTE
jgi:hypothetical protein